MADVEIADAGAQDGLLSEPIKPEGVPAQPASESAETEDDDGAPVETVSDLAELLETDPSEIWRLAAGVDVDGETKRVSLGELKDTYRDIQKIQRERAQIQQAREQLEQETRGAQERLRRQLAEAAELTESAERSLSEKYQGINWAQLKEEDPSQWSLLRQEYRDSQDQIQAARRRVEEKIQEFSQNEARQLQAHYQEMRAREHSRLLSAIPEWSDPAKFKAGANELQEYLTGAAGFTPDEVGQVLDHRLIVLARKAAMYDRRESESQTAKKRVLKIGKRVTKPGATESKQTAQAQQVTAARSQLKKTGKTRDAVALLRLRRGQ